MSNYYDQDVSEQSPSYYDEEFSWGEQCYDLPQYYMQYQYEEPVINNSMMDMCLRLKEENDRMFARIDELEENTQRMHSILSSNMNREEEFIEETLDMKVDMHQVSSESPHEDDFYEEFKKMLGVEVDDSSSQSMGDHMVLLDGQIQVENIEPPKYREYGDFVETFKDASLEKPCIQLDTNSREYIGEWMPKILVEITDEGIPIKPKGSDEDPFFFSLPKDKFQSFQPFISQYFGRSFVDPFASKEYSFIKGSKFERKVHCRLNGRKFKWDLKVD